MIYRYYITRERPNGTYTVLGVTKETETHIVTRALWDSAFPEDIGMEQRLSKDMLTRRIGAKGFSFDVSHVRPEARSWGEAASIIAGDTRRHRLREYA